MANSEDFVFGRDRDEMLERMLEEVPSLDINDATGEVAGAIWLDEQAGLRQPGDYVLLNPGMAMWFLAQVTMVDPALSRALEVLDMDVLQRLAVAQPFEVEFTSPDGEELTEQLPANVRGQRVLVRIMNERESERLSFVHTVRASGEFIELPSAVWPRSVDEISG